MNGKPKAWVWLKVGCFLNDLSCSVIVMSLVICRVKINRKNANMIWIKKMPRYAYAIIECPLKFPSWTTGIFQFEDEFQPDERFALNHEAEYFLKLNLKFYLCVSV